MVAAHGAAGDPAARLADYLSGEAEALTRYRQLLAQQNAGLADVLLEIEEETLGQLSQLTDTRASAMAAWATPLRDGQDAITILCNRVRKLSPRSRRPKHQAPASKPDVVQGSVATDEPAAPAPDSDTPEPAHQTPPTDDQDE